MAATGMKDHVVANWSHAVLVCRKCQKKAKLKYGKSGSRKLSTYLRKKLLAKKCRKSPIGVIEVGCLDICPKKGVVVIDSRAPQRWHLVNDRTDLDQLAMSLASSE